MHTHTHTLLGAVAAMVNIQTWFVTPHKKNMLDREKGRLTE